MKYSVSAYTLNSIYFFIFAICFSCCLPASEEDDFTEYNPPIIEGDTITQQSFGPCDLNFNYTHTLGCDNQVYLDPTTSKYILPFKTGECYPLGLGNCASSFHAAGSPDQYAYDFNMPVGKEFIAVRSGHVISIEEGADSNGGGAGNWVDIDHGDGTYAVYLHSPKDGIYVEEGDYVEQGQVLGITGKSGLAGYPHLHLTLIHGEYVWPYTGTPITFRNVSPAHIVLESRVNYEACKWE